MKPAFNIEHINKQTREYHTLCHNLYEDECLSTTISLHKRDALF